MGFPAQSSADIVAIFGQEEPIMLLLPRAVLFFWAGKADSDILAQSGVFPLGKETVYLMYLPNFPGFSLIA